MSRHDDRISLLPGFLKRRTSVTRRSPGPGWSAYANRLIHGYDLVDWAVLQSTISADLPQLVTQLDAILGP